MPFNLKNQLNLNLNSIVNQNNTEKYKWGPQCFGWHYLNSSKLSVIREEMGPGRSEKLHYHQYAQQFFYILMGTASVNIDGKSFKICEDEGIYIPPKAIHSIVNNSNENLEFIVITVPHAHQDKTIMNNI